MSLVVVAASVLLTVIATAGPAAWAQTGSRRPVTLVQAAGTSAPAESSSAPAAPAVSGSAPVVSDSAPAPPAEATDRSGYYFRGALALDRTEAVEFRDEDCASQSPAALYGCGTGNDGEPLHGLVDSGSTVGFEAGFGRVVTPGLRLEGLVHYRPGVSLDGEANFVQTQARQDISTELSAYGALVAAYLDIPWLDPVYGIPFLGAGLGASRIDVKETRMTFTRTSTLVPGGRTTDFTWMVTAGIGMPLTGRVTLDVAWRYTDYGRVRTEAGRGAIVWRDGSREPLELDLAPTRGRLRTHGVVMGLRYAF